MTNFMEQLTAQSTEEQGKKRYPWQTLTTYPCPPASLVEYKPFFLLQREHEKGWYSIASDNSWAELASLRRFIEADAFYDNTILRIVDKSATNVGSIPCDREEITLEGRTIHAWLPSSPDFDVWTWLSDCREAVLTRQEEAKFEQEHQGW